MNGINRQGRDRAVLRLCDEPSTSGIDQESATVLDLWQPARTFPRPAMALTVDHDLRSALTGLVESLAVVLGLSGVGVAVAEEDGRHQLLAAVGPASGELQRSQEQGLEGPSRTSHETGEAVCVTDVREESSLWPEFSAAAHLLAVAGVAVIPIRVTGDIIGTLSLYSAQPREWSDQDIAVATVMAEVSAGYAVNISRFRQGEHLNEQLQEALTARVVVEQAKGMTAARHLVSIDQAYRLIRRYSRNHNTRLRTVAETIVAHGPSSLSLTPDRPDPAQTGTPRGSRAPCSTPAVVTV